MVWNKFQTKQDSELLRSLPKEVYNELIDYTESVGFIRNLISAERKTITEAEKNEEGKVIVDIVNPHILEDMDYFRKPAIHFQEHKRYTLLTPNSNPRSEFAKFWRKELDRWKNGLVREDGEWIPGTYYFYLNYAPIWKVREENEEGSHEGIIKRVKGKKVYGFPDIWLGDYLFFHYLDQAEDTGSHAKLLKARRKGYSHKISSISPRNMYVYPGIPNFHIASDKTYLEGEKGVFGKAVTVLDWLGEHTPFARIRSVDRMLEKQLGYKDEYGTLRGLKSSIYGYSIKDDPDKVRGISGKLLQYEEDGKMPELESAWNINLSALEQGNITYGLAIAGGTGGTEGSDFEGSEKLFYYPNAYKIHGIPNLFDKNSDGSSKCGFFWGAYLNREGCIRENGESDIVKALAEVLLNFYNIRKGSSDPKVLTQRRAEDCLTPQDSIMRIEGSFFPVADLKDYLFSIMPSIKSFVAPHMTGRITSDIKFEFDDTLQPIREFPLTASTINKSGAIEIFEMPKIDPDTNRAIENRYIGGIDSVDQDWGVSLFSMFIFDTWTDRIVAEYTGRTKLVDEVYEIARRLLVYYSAKANYENSNSGIYSYFKNHNCLYLFCETPEILIASNFTTKKTWGSRTYGTPPSERVNEQARMWYANWLLTDAYGETGEIINDNGEVKQAEKKKNYEKIRSIGLLKESIAWKQDLNCDRISAIGMVMIYREDVKVRYSRESRRRVEEKLNDSFFNRHYKDKFYIKQDVY